MLKPSAPTPEPKNARGLTIRVRVTKTERDAFQDAAELAGITASSWCRMVLRQEAAARLKAAGKDHGL